MWPFFSEPHWLSLVREKLKKNKQFCERRFKWDGWVILKIWLNSFIIDSILSSLNEVPFTSWSAMQQFLVWHGKRQKTELRAPLVLIILDISIWSSYWRILFTPPLLREWSFYLLNLIGGWCIQYLIAACFFFLLSPNLFDMLVAFWVNLAYNSQTRLPVTYSIN